MVYLQRVEDSIDKNATLHEHQIIKTYHRFSLIAKNFFFKLNEDLVSNDPFCCSKKTFL